MRANILRSLPQPILLQHNGNILVYSRLHIYCVSCTGSAAHFGFIWKNNDFAFGIKKKVWISSKVSNVLQNSFYPSYLKWVLVSPSKKLVLHFESTRWSPCFSPLPNIWEVIQCISFNGKLFSGLILSFIRIKLDFFSLMCLF